MGFKPFNRAQIYRKKDKCKCFIIIFLQPAPNIAFMYQKTLK